MITILLFYIFLALATQFIASSPAPVGSVPMRLVNNAGASIELFWNDVFSAKEPGEGLKLVKQTTKPIRNSSDTTVSASYLHLIVLYFYLFFFVDQ